MPYKDPDKQRSYKREWTRMRRAGECGTPSGTPLPEGFRSTTARDILAELTAQIEAVKADPSASVLEKARCIGYLAGVSLKAVEAADLSSRVVPARGSPTPTESVVRSAALSKKYAELRPLERVELMLQAQARDDGPEVDRLADSAPRKKYINCDQEVTTPWRGTFAAAMTWGWLWARAHRDWLVSAALDFSQEPKSDANSRSAWAFAQLAGTYDGLLRFTDLADIDARLLIRAWLGGETVDEVELIRGGLEEFLSQDGDIAGELHQAAQETANRVNAVLCAHWPALVEHAQALLVAR